MTTTVALRAPPPLPWAIVQKLQAPIDDSIGLREWVRTLRHLERRRTETTTVCKQIKVLHDDAEYKESRRRLQRLKDSMIPRDYSKVYRQYWQLVEQRPAPTPWPDGETSDVHALRELAASCSSMYDDPL
jgi:hypothetical protein